MAKKTILKYVTNGKLLKKWYMHPTKHTAAFYVQASYNIFKMCWEFSAWAIHKNGITECDLGDCTINGTPIKDFIEPCRMDDKETLLDDVNHIAWAVTSQSDFVKENHI
jgi:hypothetical protein